VRGGVRERGVHRPDLGAAFDFVPVEESHLPMLREWLLRPHVARWWGDPGSPEAMRTEHRRNASRPNATREYIVNLDGAPIGFIQSYVVMGSGDGWWQDETDPGARGIDQFLADASKLGQGIGRAMIGAFVQVLFADPAVTVVQTDPSPANGRAIRCYQAAGFVAAGIVATPDGDALLMRRSR
jgi:RimJ/RimL family protein N-acetyltransferase